MGGALTAPLALVGSCCGSCLAASCCKLAGSGEVSSDRAAKFVLIWLQAFGALLATILSMTAGEWLPGTCNKLNEVVNAANFGICGCSADVTGQADCWSDQLVYRVEGSLVLVLLVVLGLTMSGCAVGASRSHVGARFIGVILTTFFLLFLPNSILSTFGDVATSASAVFLVAQAILLIDFAYTLNEIWYEHALIAYRTQVDQRYYKAWMASIIVISCAIFFTGIGCAIHLFVAYPDTAGRVVNVLATVLSIVLLVVSITDWCEHGALLTSTIVTLYTVYMLWEMLALLPSGDGPHLPVWVKLTICSISLLTSAQNAKALGAPPGAPAPNTLQAAEMGQAPQSGGTAPAGQVPSGSGEEGGAIDKNQFAVQCAVHTAAALYICSSLAPKAGEVTFAFHAVAVFVALTLYGWSLVAPKVLSGRDFS
jgi:hypothetical protein